MVAFAALWLAMYFILGSILRWWTIKFPNNAVTDAVLFVHG